MKQVTVAIAALTGLLSLAQPALAAPLDQHIVTNPTWQSTASQPGSSWATVGFDASSWAPARVVNPPDTPANILGGPTAAQFIWDSTSNATGTGGPNEVWLRYVFHVSLAPDSLPYLAQLLMAVDDDFEIFVNGASLLLNNDQGNATYKYVVNFTGLLQDGANVIAIHAVDGGWGNPWDRGYQWVLVDGTVRTVPEPAAIAVFGAGLIALAGIRGRRVAGLRCTD